MKKHFLPFLALLLALAVNLPAKDTTKPAPYFTPAAVNLQTLLGDWPPPDSPEGKQEITDLLALQTARTAAQLERIKIEAHYTYYVFDDVIGPWFTKVNLAKMPALTKLLDRVAATANPLITLGKDRWKRPRPFLVDSRINPPIDRPKEFAYPSGHTTMGTLDALVFAELMPDEKDALVARGLEVGEDREIAGVHYPSDVSAGKKLGQTIFDLLMADKSFAADLAEAKAEIVAVRVKAQ